MSLSVEQIAGIVERRRRDRSAVIRAMREIRDVYNTDIVVPLPEMDQNERPFVPNLILRAIDQTASRISSVQPTLACPPSEPSDPDSRRVANRRREAILGWWENSDLELADAQRARWFVGYGAAATIIRPDTKAGLPTWEMRDPLDAFPSPPTGNPARDITPADCAFLHRHPYSWLLRNYPRQAVQLGWGRNPGEIDPGEMFDVIEWFDENENVLVGLANAVSNPYDPWERQRVVTHSSYVELDRLPNRIGMCQVVMPGRITLDRPRGQFDAAVGMYHAHAKLMALGMIAVERDVFPDMFLTARQPGETPRFITGPYDGRTGQWNEVEGIPQALGQPMGQQVTNMLDRVERAEGITGGIPAEFGGESSTNIRTGRRGEQVLEAVINFPMAEAQRILARARAAETRRAQAVAKAWFGEREKTIFVEMVNRSITYRADEFDSEVVSVVYPVAGTDANNLTIATGQMVGARAMSRRTMMELSPFIRDAEAEHDQIQAEAMEDAALAAILAQSQQGALPLPDLARILELVSSDRRELVGAIVQAQREAQERQASSGEPGTATGPALPGAPEAQPGLAMPGMGAEQPTAPARQPSLREAMAAAMGAA